MSAELRGLHAAVLRLSRSLARHQERYIRAYCARYGIDAADFDQYVLVTQTMPDGSLHTWMQRREDRP